MGLENMGKLGKMGKWKTFLLLKLFIMINIFLVNTYMRGYWGIKGKIR
jgi:hypothetical protein